MEGVTRLPVAVLIFCLQNEENNEDARKSNDELRFESVLKRNFIEAKLTSKKKEQIMMIDFARGCGKTITLWLSVPLR